MTSRQQITQMQRYWTDLSHLASNDAKKKSMDSRFGIRDIKIDKKGNIISYKTERGKLVDKKKDLTTKAKGIGVKIKSLRAKTAK